ncbi:TSUP family transporter [Qipengyuania sp.]|uniref:TSUP family transporter n=1 Tax=Qipengyuania sp. TaxID=2004515 RepID=UPI003735B216
MADFAIAGFALWQVGIALAATLASAFVRGLAGFGMAILLVPVIALALDPVQAVMTANLLGLLVGLTEWRWIMGYAERSARTISAMVALTTLPGLVVLALTPAPLARLLIAIVALSAFAAMLMPPRKAAVHGRPATLAVGAASGLLTGFAGMPGPPVVPYYVGRPIPREVAKASMILIFTVAGGIGLMSGAVLGELDLRLLALALSLFPVVVIGNWLGRKASGHVGDKAWRIFAAAVLGAAALAAILKL